METATNTTSSKKPAGLPALPPGSKTPNIFAGLERDIDLKRSERNDPTSTAVIGRKYLMVALTAVVAASSLQTRAPFCPTDDGEDQALVESIELVGQQMPVTLERLADRQPPEYRVLDGHRRIAALRHLGRTQVEAIVIQSGTQDGDLLTLSANVRKNLAPLELAEAIGRLEARGMSHAEIGRRIGLTRVYICNLGSLLRLSEPLRQQMQAGRLGVKAAVLWAGVPSEHHEALAQLCSEVDVTVPQAHTVAEMLNSGATVTAAAEAAGCALAAAAVDESAAGTASPAAPKKARKPKPNRILGVEASGDLLRGYFPDLEARTVWSLAEAAARHRTSELDLKTAGCLAAAGLTPAEALERARLMSGRPLARRVVAMLDGVADLEALCTGDHCSPDAARLISVLIRRVSAVKALVRGTGGPARGPKTPTSAKP